MERTWSPQQEAIFTWFEHGKGNLVARARAGTGKTTTIIEGVNRAPEQNILFAAFNSRIVKELAKRITNPRAQAKTLHSLGFAIVRSYWNGIGVEPDDRTGQRAAGLTERVCGITPPDTVKYLVTKLHTKAREIAPLADSAKDLEDLAFQFECEPDPMWWRAGYDLRYVCTRALDAMHFAAKEKPVATGIDFADMIFLPVRNDWAMKTYDMVVIDEAQDMTVAQLALALSCCAGRVCVVGDDRQAIYGFRGADSGSLDRLKRELQATELPLTVTYRCGYSIVAAAQALVPDFTAADSNPMGSVTELHESQLVETAQVGDFILSRLNAPLVGTAMALLRAGKRTRVAGKDIGRSLLALVRKLAKSSPNLTIEGFIERLRLWEEREIARFTAAGRDNQVQLTRDKAAMLVELTDGAVQADELVKRIEFLFVDDGLGDAGVITCSSVHKAKGLEAKRVFILVDTLYPFKITQEEYNIHYVAITRAKESLVLVTAKLKEEVPPAC